MYTMEYCSPSKGEENLTHATIGVTVDIVVS